MPTYRHAGDSGDLIAFLPVMRYHGRGVLFIEAATYTRVKMTPERYAPLIELLEYQPYVEKVQQWMGQSTDICGNDFRARMFKELRNLDSPYRSKSLVDWQLETHGVPYSAQNEAWISVPEVRRESAVVFSRSTRYHNPLFPWTQIVSKYGKDAVFCGLPEEHQEFARRFGPVPFLPTHNFMELAKVIGGCDLFVGNQSCPHMIAEAMKKNVILECWNGGRNCCFYRKGVAHGIDGAIYYPVLQS